MELSELQYFRVVANLEHVTKAAQELHVSQPNLSNAITRLENKLGAKVFERTRGRSGSRMLAGSICAMLTMPL